MLFALAFSITSLALCGFVRLILTVAPLDHTIPSQPTRRGKRIKNSAYVTLIRPEKVSDLGGIDFKPTSIINLRSAFENGSPNPDDALDDLFGSDGNSHELFVAHHPGVVAEPSTHDSTISLP